MKNYDSRVKKLESNRGLNEIVLAVANSIEGGYFIGGRLFIEKSEAFVDSEKITLLKNESPREAIHRYSAEHNLKIDLLLDVRSVSNSTAAERLGCNQKDKF